MTRVPAAYEDDSGDRAVVVAAGAAQGLAFWLLQERWPEAYQLRALSVGALTLLAVASLVFHFCWTGESRGRLVGLATGVGAAYAAVATWVGWQLPRSGEAFSGDGARVETWIPVCILTVYTLGPFLQIAQSTGRLRFPYERLVTHAWSNAFIALIAGLFVGSLWILLLLWGELFHLIGIDVFKDLFQDRLFAYCLTGAAAGWGIALGRGSERVVATLRIVTLAIFRTLLPLVCIVAVVFLAALPFTGLGTLRQTSWGSSILLAWTAATILLLNAVYQDGTGRRPYHPVVRGAVELGLLALVAFATIAIHGLGLRIGQYGLTPERVWGLVVAALLGLYALGYAGAVILRGPVWLGAVRPVNLTMAILVVLTGLLLHTPVLDPLRLSARNQLGRLTSGRASADAFDYEFLRFHLGRAGAAALGRLEHLDHPDSAIIRANVARARAASHHQARLRRPTIALDGIVPVQFDAWPDGLFDAVLRAVSQRHLRECDQSRACTIAPVDLDHRPGAEFVLQVPRGGRSVIVGFARDERGSWADIGEFVLEPERQRPFPSGDRIRRAIRAGEVGTAEPDFDDLVISGERFRLVPR